MREKVIYVAEDGTEFDHEDDCRNYENFEELRPYFENVQLWDCMENPIATPSDYAEMTTALEEMHYAKGAVSDFIDAIYSADMEHMMLDYSTFRQESYNVSENELLMFDGDFDCWVNVNDLYKQYRNILKNFSVI